MSSTLAAQTALLLTLGLVMVRAGVAKRQLHWKRRPRWTKRR